MNKTKIRLSRKEKELAGNKELILTKNKILNKITLQLETLTDKHHQILRSFSGKISDDILSINPKISKGENYNGLPWRVLDHPGIFNKEGICAIRTLFWWGNFFSVTLQLSGVYKEKYESSILTSYSLLQKKKIFCCINTDQWQHHFKKDNYILVNKMGKKGFEEVIRKKDFIKLAKKIQLKKWDSITKKITEYFCFLAAMLATDDQLPNR
ncbi:MAG: hypothetical protein HZB42_01490 [Sphingobacteriales bacterium]|nr:hypothetical protein [Sphingobacteriales bacterium]